MYRGNINLPADETDYSALIDDLKQRQIEKRVLAYIKKVIRNSPNSCCFVSQAVIRKTLKVRKQAITDACRNITERGELIRIDTNNKNRKNAKPIYFLPDAELSGNSIKSSFLSEGETQNEVSVIPHERSESRRIEEVEIEAGRLELAPNFSDVDKWKNLDRLSLIEKYLDAGLMITPLIERGKRPPEGWNKEKLRKTSKEEMLNFFAQNPELNVGCWMPSKLVAADIDDLVNFYALNGGEIYDTLAATSGRENGGAHYYFFHNGNIGTATELKDKTLDLKTNGSLMVLPPSIHKSGTAYKWSNLVTPQPAPDLIYELYDTRPTFRPDAESSVTDQAQRSSSPFLTAETVLKETERYNHLFPVGRRLRFRLDAEQVTAELNRYNQLCCKPPLNEERMRKLINDVLFSADRKDFRKD